MRFKFRTVGLEGRFVSMEMLRTLIGPDDGYQTVAQLSARAVLLFAFGILCIRMAGRRTFSQAAPWTSSSISSSVRTYPG
jgi:hypothetical protein